MPDPAPSPSGQTWSAQTYAENARFVSDLGTGVVEWLAPQAGERILDLGCGDGALTVSLIAAGASVVGVDSSPSMVEGARARGIDAHIADATALPFHKEFDAVFSNAAMHWMRPPEAVATGVARALKAGGRFVGEFGGFGNVASIVATLAATYEAMDGERRGVDRTLAKPWYFPRAEEYSALLENAGFAVERITLFSRPTLLPTGIRGWLDVMCAPFFDAFGDARAEAYRRVEAALKPALCDASGQWWADYVRLRFAARLTA